MDVLSGAVLAAAHGAFAPTRFARTAGCVYAGLVLLRVAAPIVHLLRRTALLVTTCAYHVTLDPDSALDAVPLIVLSVMLDAASFWCMSGDGTDAMATGYVMHVARLYWVAGVSMAPPLGAAMVAIAAARPTLQVAARLAVAAALPGAAAIATRSSRFRYLVN